MFSHDLFLCSFSRFSLVKTHTRMNHPSFEFSSETVLYLGFENCDNKKKRDKISVFASDYSQAFTGFHRLSQARSSYHYRRVKRIGIWDQHREREKPSEINTLARDQGSIEPWSFWIQLGPVIESGVSWLWHTSCSYQWFGLGPVSSHELFFSVVLFTSLVGSSHRVRTQEFVVTQTVRLNS